MKKQELKKGDLVQLDPASTRNQAFAGCFLVVTEPNEFGAQGYIQAIGDNRDTPGGRAYYRAQWDEMEWVGQAEWIIEGE